MQGTERDPRRVPAEGDVLLRGMVRRRVKGVFRDPFAVIVEDVNRKRSLGERWPTLKQYRQWAKNAEVIHAAGN